MSRKRSNIRKFSGSSTKGKNTRVAVAKIDDLYHQTLTLLKTTIMLFVVLYLIGGTLAMSIVYHQHRGHLFSWLAGDESRFQKQAAMEHKKKLEEAELEAECQASYHLSCTEYALSIAEATQSNGKHDAKQISMLEKAKSKARAM